MCRKPSPWRTASPAGYILAAVTIGALTVLVMGKVAAQGSTVGGLQFLEQSRSTGASGPAVTLPEDLVTVAQGLSELAADLPRWTPPGFRPDANDASITLAGPSEEWLALFWSNDLGDGISLHVLAQPESTTWLVGPGSVSEIEVAGKRVAVVYGSWDYPSGQWRTDREVTLRWIQGGSTYILGGADTSDLVHMAQSMPFFQE